MNAFVSETPELTVVVPCHNEADSIEEVIRSWTEVLDPAVSYEMLLINDGSSDGTGRVLDRLRRELKGLRVIHQLNSGHSKTVWRGYEMARGRYILQVDGNGKYEAREFRGLWEKRSHFDLVIGLRPASSAPRWQRSLQGALLWWLRLLFKNRLRDPGSPLRLFRREPALSLLPLLPKTTESVNFSLTLLTQRHWPERVTEVPVSVRGAKEGAYQRTRSSAAGRLRHFLALCTEALLLRYGGNTAPAGLAPARH